jgi:hypothetical protein
MGTAPPQWVRYRVWDKFVKKTNFYNKTTITELKYKNLKIAFVQRVYIYQSTLPVCNPVLWIRTDFNADSDPAF